MDAFSSLFNRYSFAKQIPIFNKLNWFDLQKIALKSSIIEYKKGEIIYQEGTEASAFYCLISGRLQAYSTNPSGEKNGR